MAKRQRRSPRSTKSSDHTVSGKPAIPLGNVPSAATVFRLKNLDLASRSMVRQATKKIRPILWLRDQAKVKEIEHAGSAEELIELLPLATGLGEDAWWDRIDQYGPEILPLIAARLKQMHKDAHSEEQDLAYDRLIETLRWRGPSGSEVLLDCFAAFNDYAGCLACVALGLAGVPGEKREKTVKTISSYYRRVAKKRQENFFVGALWGLIDLHSALAVDILLQHLEEGRNYYEMFGFLALSGDARVILQLLALASQGKDQPVMEDAMFAVVCIAHRIGRQALIDQIVPAAPEDEGLAELEKMVDGILSVPMNDAREYFGMFFRGFEQEDLGAAFKSLEI